MKCRVLEWDSYRTAAPLDEKLRELELALTKKDWQSAKLWLKVLEAVIDSNLEATTPNWRKR